MKTLTMDSTQRKRAARRMSGLAHIESGPCRLTRLDGRMVKAWRVSSTPEHGKWCMARAAYEKLMQLK